MHTSIGGKGESALANCLLFAARGRATYRGASVPKREGCATRGREIHGPPVARRSGQCRSVPRSARQVAPSPLRPHPRRRKIAHANGDKDVPHAHGFRTGGRDPPPINSYSASRAHRARRRSQSTRAQTSRTAQRAFSLRRFFFFYTRS